MGVVFDIIGMLVVRAAIITIILNLMVNMHEALHKKVERLSLSTLITAPAQTISADVKLAGYNVTSPIASVRAYWKKFKVAKDTAMYFRYDIDNDNTLDSVKYYLNPTTGTNKSLYRCVNEGSGMLVAADVDTFNVKYYTVTGTAATGTADVVVKFLKVTLVLKSTIHEATSGGGTSESATPVVKWEQYFFPENL